MDQVFPGVNNVARHIRPFVVVTWAWRRAKQLAEKGKAREIDPDKLKDFVDRLEVIYAASQFLRNPNADLPGRQVLASLLQTDRWVFGGKEWRKRRENRRLSTAFTAPITYGPALKTLRWVEQHVKHREVLIPTQASQPALDAFERQIADRLEHPAFCLLGSVEVTRSEAMDWAKAWALERVTRAEKAVMAEMLLGAGAPIVRKNGGTLMIQAATHSGLTDPSMVRRVMAGAPSNFTPAAEVQVAFEAWRRVQVRQLFRFSLEAMFHWIFLQVSDEPRSSEVLARRFIKQVGRSPQIKTTQKWLKVARPEAVGPVELMELIQNAFDNLDELPSTILEGLAFSIAEAPDHGQLFERADRLPLFRARKEAESWSTAPVTDFVRHMIESWVLAQHVYWSVGRGLADARVRGKSILRLKLVLEEQGWTPAPGAALGSPPLPTPDRLGTMLNLASECALIPFA
jgi:hypothetical protein